MLAEQGNHPVPDQMHGRLEAGDEQKQSRADELLGGRSTCRHLAILPEC
jgi:hypothetical protein